MRRFLIICSIAIAGLTSRAEADDAGVAAAEKLFKQGKYKQAGVAMERLVEASPGVARYHYLFGECLYFQDKYTEAAMEFKAAFNLEPAQGLYAGRACESYIAAGRKTDADNLCDKAAFTVSDAQYLKQLQALKLIATDKIKAKIRRSGNDEDCVGGRESDTKR